MLKGLLPHFIENSPLTNRSRINAAIFRHPTGSSFLSADGEYRISRHTRLAA
jgi:hypothetical protein